MAINRVEIKNFLVFKGEFAMDFCPGVNVIIGGNATGKTTLLKYLWVKERGLDPDSFKDNLYWHTPKYGVDDYDKHPLIFIPVTEMLTHSKGFLGLNTRFEMPFDQTEVDILAFATSPVTRELTLNAVKTLDKIKDVIGGEVRYENDTFYIGERPFSFEASGYRKLGLLWKLLRNGLLESDSVLFWDEPENSLNPELMPVLVEILLELQRGGAQIFLATHSEILASYFDVKHKPDDSVMFYSLYKDGEQIKADESERFDLLVPNNLTAEQVELYEQEVEKGLG
ncbi:hypothetical protein AGMMS50276_05280 [Synergistales bacterium]|nr:hypothetical protein AGMMS50276_05280 [Synergistales bacterium]